MTIDEFMDSFGIKRKSTVVKWLEKDLIPGSYMNDDNEWVILKLARPPYTRARAKTANAIYTSIVKACNLRKGVCSKLYKIPEEEFEEYITNLKKAGLISTEKDKGTTFYFATPKRSERIDDRMGVIRYIHNVCKMKVECVAEGVTKGTLDKMMKT